MAEDRVVFDFTSEEFWKDLEDCGDLYGNYTRLRNDGIKKYTTEEIKGKVIVSFITEKNVQYDCIYYKKTLDDIEKLIKNKESVNLKGCYIKDFDITKIKKYQEYELLNFDASHSFWSGETYFSHVSFIGDIKFDRANFEGEFLCFIKTYFIGGKVSFSNSWFNCDAVNFEYVYFGEGNVVFYKSIFRKGLISFKNTNIESNNISFYETIFKNNNIKFSNTNFNNANLNFFMSEIRKGTLSFTNCKFGIGYKDLHSLKMHKGSLNFSGCKFGSGDLTLESASVNKCVFFTNVFTSHFNLNFKKINILTIKNSIIEKTVKIGGIPTFFSLENSANLGHIYFEDEPKKIIGSLISSFINNRKMPEKLKLNQLTLLKENYHSFGEYDGEDLAYRTYMKYKTNSKWYRWPLKFFSLVGGYGTKPLSIIIAMLVTMFGFAGVYFALFMGQFKEVLTTFWDTLYYSGITFLTIGYGDISPAFEGSNALRFVSVAEGFIGLFLMSYLTVAVVRKLLR